MSETIRNFKENYQEYIDREIFPHLLNIDQFRKKYLKDFIVTVIVILATIAGIIYYLITSETEINNFIFGILVFIGLVMILAVYTPIGMYQRKTKGSIMPRITAFFEGLEHKQGNIVFTCIPNEIIRNSQIIPKFDLHNCDDSITGSYKGVTINIEETSLIKTSHMAGRQRRIPVFKGLIIQLKTDKQFNGKTIILKDLGIINNFLKDKARKLQNIKLQNHEFEKKFEVYTSDQQEAQDILTDNFMQDLQKMSELFENAKLQMSLFDNNLFIAININKNLFEPASLFKSALDTERVELVFREIIQILNMIEILKQNEKIGI